MPGFVNPDEQESRQTLYRDLLSHLNETVWGSPSTLDNLNPIKTIGETYSELTYRPSEEELKANSIDYGPEGKTLPKTIAGKLSRFTRKFTLDQLYSGANALERAYEGRASMQDATEAALTALSGGALGGGTGVANQIRGVPKDVAKAIRKVMQNEIKVRGKAPYGKTSGSTEAQAYTEELAGYKKMQSYPETFDFDAPEPEIFHKNVLESEESVASRLLRGTWYRGQEEYPTILGKEKVIDPVAGKEVEELVTRQFGKEYAGESPTYMGMRAKSSNVGEPHGISLSYEPRVSARFNAPETLPGDKLQDVLGGIKFAKDMAGEGSDYDKYAKLAKLPERANQLASTTKVGRVMPLYGSPPEDKILMAWKPEHGEEFRSAYIEAAQEMMNKHKMLKHGFENLAPGESGNAIKQVIDNTSYYSSKYESSRDEFNSTMSRILRERGWKGMLHSPHRYQEYELRMFDPYDVMHIDKRAVAKYSADNPMQSQAVQRLRDMKRPLMREHEAVTSGKPKSLGDFYRDITREELLGQPKLTRDPRAVELEMHQDALIKSYPTEVETFLPSDWKKLPKDELLNDIKGIYGEGSPKEQFLKPWVEQYFEDMNKVVKGFMKQDKIAKAKQVLKSEEFDIDLSGLDDIFKEDPTKLIQSYEQAHELTKAKLKNMTDKANGYISDKVDEKAAWASFKNTMSVLMKKIDTSDDFMSNAEKSFGKKLKELGPDGALDYLYNLVNPFM